MDAADAKEKARIAILEWVHLVFGTHAVFYDIQTGVDRAMKKGEEQLYEILSKQADMEGRN